MGNGLDAAAVEPESRAARKRWLLLAGLLAVGSLVLALPTETNSITGLLVSAMWSAMLGALAYLCLRSAAPLLALLVFHFGLAYSESLGDYVAEGVTRVGQRVPPESARYALLLILVSLVTTTLAALVVHRWLRVKRRPVPTHVESTRWAVWALFAITFAMAVDAGFWTFYGGGRDDANVGGFRLELHYPQLLFAVFAFHVSTDLPRRGTRASNVIKALAVVLLAAGLFVLQQRRLMFACVTWTVVLMTIGPSVLDPSVRPTRRRPKWLLALGMVAFVGIAVIGSEAWRRVGGGGSFLDRVDDTISQVGERPVPNVEQLRGRFTYSWIDGMSVEHAEQTTLSLIDVAASELAVSVPRALWPGKDSVGSVDCETAFRRFGLRVDLPCTSVSEGFLGGGTPGVLLVSLLAGLFLGLASHLSVGAHASLRFAAFVLFSSWIDVETGAFPEFRSARATLLLGVPVWLVATLLERLPGRFLPSEPRGPRASLSTHAGGRSEET